MNRRQEREEYRAKGNGYYHFCTDGLKEGLIFNNAAEFAFGMCLMGLLWLKFSIRIYAFELMPNHIHIILSGTGENCLMAFDYLKRKLSARLLRDGYPPLPDDYWFKLVRLENQEELKNEILYILRNPLEKGFCIVGGYIWGTEWIYYSRFPKALEGTLAGKMSKRSLSKLFASEEDIPEHWRINPYLGLLPDSFVDTSVVRELFPSPKRPPNGTGERLRSLFPNSEPPGRTGRIQQKRSGRYCDSDASKAFWRTGFTSPFGTGKRKNGHNPP